MKVVRCDLRITGGGRVRIASMNMYGAVAV